MMYYRTNDVLQNKWTGHCTNLEGVSFSLFNNVWLDTVYITKDWLDFSVEHLLHYFKSINTLRVSIWAFSRISKVVVTKLSKYLISVRQI